MLSFDFFLRFLLSKKAGSLVRTISYINFLGLWLGVSALIIVVSVMNGFNRSIHSRLLAVEPHLILEFNKIHSVSEVKNHPLYKRINELEVDFVTPVSRQDVILRTREGFVQGAVAHGVTRRRLLQLLEYGEKRADQKDPNLKEKIQNLSSGELILGERLASSVGLFRDDSVVLIPPETLLLPTDEVPRFSQALVKGFINTDIDRVDNQSFFYIIGESLPHLQKTASRKLSLEVWLKDPIQAEMIKKQLALEDVKIETWQSRNASLFFALKMEKMVIGLLVALSTLIAGLSIISVMVLLLTQKRKDVGNLLVMGLTQEKTRNLFVNIGLYLTLFGIVAGVLTGVFGSFFIDAFSKDVLPAFYEETNIPADVQWEQVLSIVIFGFVLSFLALHLTIKKLSSFQPSKILRD